MLCYFSTFLIFLVDQIEYNKLNVFKEKYNLNIEMLNSNLFISLKIVFEYFFEMIVNFKISSLNELKERFCNKMTNISLKSN